MPGISVGSVGVMVPLKWPVSTKKGPNDDYVCIVLANETAPKTISAPHLHRCCRPLRFHAIQLHTVGIILVLECLSVCIPVTVQQRGFTRCSDDCLLFRLFPHADDDAACHEHGCTEPPQPGEALAENDQTKHGREDEVGRRIDDANAHGGRRKSQGAGKQTPHDGVEEEIHAKEELRMLAIWCRHRS